MKKCRSCGIVKPLDDFQPESRVRDGRAATCRKCHRLKYGAYKGRTEEQLARHRREERERRLANPERARRIKRAEYERNREKYAARTKRWRRENAERRRKQSVVDARRRRLDRDADAVAYADVLRRDVCSYCGTSHTDEVDHIVPSARGGANNWTNLTAACRRCNLTKNAMPMLHFLLGRA